MKSLILFLTCLFSSVVLGQTDCSEVLLLAGRNVSSQTKTALILKNVYDKYCSSSDIANSNEFSADIDVLKKVGISLGSGSQKQQKTEMCKIYESKYQSQIFETGYESNVVVDAINAWRQCQGLEGVKFNLTHANDIYTIEVKALTGKKVVIEGVNFKQTELTVRAKVDGVYNSIDPSFQYELQGENIFTVDVERIFKQENGAEYYPKSGIIIKTNLGSYPVIFPKEALPKYQWLSEIDSQMNALEDKIESQQNELKALGLNALFRDDMIFGISNYHGRDQDKTFRTTNLFTHSETKGKNRTYWYDINGKAINSFDESENVSYNVWANVLVKGKKNFEQQNFNIYNDYLGEFVAGKEHQLLKIGSTYTHGERDGGISVMFIAIKK